MRSLQLEQGVYTALVTPFSNGEVDDVGLQTNLEHQMRSGVSGVVLLGTTGESPTVTSKERVFLIESTLECIGSKLPVIVGTGSNNTAVTIEETKRARDLGASAALVVAPYYNKPSQDGLRAHFIAVAEETDFPIILYNVPGRTGVRMLPETIATLCKHPNIIGVKQSYGDLTDTTAILGDTKESECLFLAGDDALMLPMIALGGAGVVSVASNLLPQQIVSLCNACLTGDFVSARELQYHLSSLFNVLFIDSNPLPIKYAMNLTGLPAGECRLPLTSLSKGAMESIRSELTKHGLVQEEKHPRIIVNNK